MLAERNAHVMDKSIDFEPITHTYHIKTSNGSDSTFQSVTSFIKSHFAPFDRNAALQAAKRGSNPKYQNKSDWEILREWSEAGKIASARGTELHAEIEEFFNESSEWNTHQAPEKLQFFEFWRDHEGQLIPYRTEWAVYDEAARLAGSIDMVFKNADGEYYIFDWKRTKPICRSQDFGRYSTTKCLSRIPDTKFWHYSLQLNTYKTIVERNYGISIAGMFLVRFHPDLSEYEKIVVPSMTQEMQALFSARGALC